MPIHDWTRVPAGTFHNFHQLWTGAFCNALNAGRLPAGYYAMIDQRLSGPIPDVLALHLEPPNPSAYGQQDEGGLAVATAPPKAQFRTESLSEAQIYARRANLVTVRHRGGRVVAVVEFVSPGNKEGIRPFREFVDKVVDYLVRDVNLLIVDLFPPTRRDPQGVHKAIWDEIQDEPFELPGNKPLTCAAYSAGPPIRALVDGLAVGDPLPAAALFLSAERYVPAPLEESYLATWNALPKEIKAELA
jgi:hypothetical protein